MNKRRALLDTLMDMKEKYYNDIQISLKLDDHIELVNDWVPDEDYYETYEQVVDNYEDILKEVGELKEEIKGLENTIFNLERDKGRILSAVKSHVSPEIYKKIEKVT